MELINVLNRTEAGSRLFALRHMRVPSGTGLRLHLGESGARRRIRDADEDMTGGTLNLAAGELRFAFQRLVAMGAVEFEFVGVHSISLHKRKTPGKSISKYLPILFTAILRF